MTTKTASMTTEAIVTGNGKALNHSQAEMIYSAMCALNNVAGRVQDSFRVKGPAGRDHMQISEYENGCVRIYLGDALGARCGELLEEYTGQHAFARSYGFDDDVTVASISHALSPV
ncbi:hypothetical protein [Burkholderia sp. Bp9131]|uniref:hypothetical protein n=1 Tax=Burkholderia sp. Bp9131 TaxID=2184571 RepID=UPI000F55E82F|nr:hypothetical protein [Burkholderia sp. Bp9131]